MTDGQYYGARKLCHNIAAIYCCVCHRPKAKNRSRGLHFWQLAQVLKIAIVLRVQVALLSQRGRAMLVSSNIQLSYSRSLKVILNDSVEQGVCVSPYQYSIETMSVSRAVSEIFSVKEQRDLETASRGRSRSLKMAPFDRPHTTFYQSASTDIALACTVFQLFDVE